MPVVIELTGAGGAGKSHICREILKKESESGSQDIILANHEKISVFHIIGYSLLNLPNIIRLILFLRKLKSESIRDRARTFTEIIIYFVRRDYVIPEKKIILFDQGLMQILRVLERKTRGAVSVSTLDRSYQSLFFAKIDKLVIVEADNDIIIERRISRDKTLFPSRESILDEMNRISDSMKKTHKDAEYVKEKWGIKVFTYVNNSNSSLDEFYNFISSS